MRINILYSFHDYYYYVIKSLCYSLRVLGIESDIYCTDINGQYKNLDNYVYPNADYYIVFNRIRVVDDQNKITDVFGIMKNIPTEAKKIWIAADPIDFYSKEQTIKNRTNYTKLIINKNIFDYIAVNKCLLKTVLEEQSLKINGVISFGYSSVLEEHFYHNLEKNIDIHFCGDLYSFKSDDRRIKNIKIIKSKFSNFVQDNNIWLDDYLKKVAQSKIELNIHGWSYEELKNSAEISRITRAIMQKTLVVSENIIDLYPYEDKKHLVFCDLNEMPNVCEHYLNDEKARINITNNAFNFWKNKHRMEDLLYNFIVNNIDENFERKNVEAEIPKVKL